MFKMDGITGVEFCTVDELVDNSVMEQLGFIRTEVSNFSHGHDRNITAYFYKEDLPYVYVECYIAKLDAYTKLIIDKKKFEVLGMKDKVVVLNTGKGDGTRAVPSVSGGKTIKAIHKCGHENREVDHIGMSLNIITEESLRECNTKQNSRNKKNLHAWGMYSDGTFYIQINEVTGILSDKDIEELRQTGFSVKVTKNKIHIEKEFVNELDAIKELRAYEERYYGEYAFNPLNDMRGHVDAKIDQLIFGTKNEEDIIRELLADYSHDAVLIARYNLEKEYQSRGMQYNSGKVLSNGRFVS